VIPLSFTQSDTPPSHKKRLDIAIRQKSSFKVEKKQATFQFKECFFYIDNKPVLDLKGHIAYQNNQPTLNFKIATLEALDLTPFPQLPRSILPLNLQGTVAGSIKLQGEWPDQLQLQGQADLSQTVIYWPEKIHKLDGVPLQAQFQIQKKKNSYLLNPLLLRKTTHTKESPILASKQNSNQWTMAGELSPALSLQSQGTWDLATIHHYTPLIKEAWKLKKMARFALSITKKERPQKKWSGKFILSPLNIYDHQFTDISANYQITPKEILMPFLQTRFESGLVEGSFQYQRESQEFASLFAVAGISAPQILPSLPTNNLSTNLLNQLTASQDTPPTTPLKIEGVVYARGGLQGILDTETLTANPVTGHAHLTIAPGRIIGIEGRQFIQEPKQDLPYFQANRHLFFDQLKAHLLWQNSHIDIINFDLHARRLTIQGKGEQKKEGDLHLNLTAQAPWWKEKNPIPFTIQGPHHALTLHTPLQNTSKTQATESALTSATTPHTEDKKIAKEP
ncbi:hypothetical protein ACQZV8_19890, partial [Magnetococcales bacterium HHB-1]